MDMNYLPDMLLLPKFNPANTWTFCVSAGAKP